MKTNSRVIRTDPWKLFLPTRVVMAILAKGLEVPRDGWTAEHFARQGRLLLVTMTRLAKITQRRAIPYVARQANSIFRQQMHAVVARAMGKIRRGKDANQDWIDIILPQHEQLWAQALAEVLDEHQADIQIIAGLLPPIQSVMGQAYHRVGLLMGHPADPADSGAIAREARDIGQRITRINDTTRAAFQRIISNAIQEGATVTETAKRIETELPRFNESRVRTIARTEMNNAWTRGSVAQFHQSRTLTHVSVIGCEAREPSSPQYRGQSTCNYPDLPVTEMDDFMAVGFHPNHTGTIVPSKFRTDQGTSGGIN